jgi:NifU-like protein involved in Fe-S cluster formation
MIEVSAVHSDRSGDQIQLSIQISEQGMIEDMRYQAEGCPETIASISWLASELIGQPVEIAKQIMPGHIKEALSLPTPKSRCALLASEVLRKALSQLPR